MPASLPITWYLLRRSYSFYPEHPFDGFRPSTQTSKEQPHPLSLGIFNSKWLSHGSRGKSNPKNIPELVCIKSLPKVNVVAHKQNLHTYNLALISGGVIIFDLGKNFYSCWLSSFPLKKVKINTPTFS